MPYRSKRKQKAATRVSTAKWYKAHKADRAAYMRKYRRRLKKAAKEVHKPAADANNSSSHSHLIRAEFVCSLNARGRAWVARGRSGGAWGRAGA